MHPIPHWNSAFSLAKTSGPESSATSPLSTCAWRRLTSAAQAFSTSGSASRLAMSLSTNRARSPGGKCNASASSASTFIDIRFTPPLSTFYHSTEVELQCQSESSSKHPKTSRVVSAPAACRIRVCRRLDNDGERQSCRVRRELPSAAAFPRPRFSRCRPASSAHKRSRPSARANVQTAVRNRELHKRCRDRVGLRHAALGFPGPRCFAAKQNESDRGGRASAETGRGDCRVRKRRRKEQLDWILFAAKYHVCCGYRGSSPTVREGVSRGVNHALPHGRATATVSLEFE